MNIKYIDDYKVMEQEMNGYLFPYFQYYYGFRAVDLTAATGITSWDEFIKKYSKITSTNATVEFHSHDNDNFVYKNDLITNFDLNKAIVYKDDITERDNTWDIPVPTGTGSVNMLHVATSIEADFFSKEKKEKQLTIFDESKDNGLLVHRRAFVVILLQSYVRNHNAHLMLRICQQSYLYSGGTTIGCTITVRLGDEIVLS